MVEVHWRFYAYQTHVGNRIVQRWFDGLSEGEKDEVRDVTGYLQKVPAEAWAKPEFKVLGDGLSEIRLRVSVLNKTIRIYGFFWPRGQRNAYTFLLGAEKKVSNPRNDIQKARKRKARVQAGEVQVHEFEF